MFKQVGGSVYWNEMFVGLYMVPGDGEEKWEKEERMAEVSAKALNVARFEVNRTFEDIELWPGI